MNIYAISAIVNVLVAPRGARNEKRGRGMRAQRVERERTMWNAAFVLGDSAVASFIPCVRALELEQRLNLFDVSDIYGRGACMVAGPG